MGTRWTSRIVRAALCAACPIVALHAAVPTAQTNASCTVEGAVAAGTRRLPGVVISIGPAGAPPVDVGASNTDGSFALHVPGPGAYAIKAELVAFAPAIATVTVGDSCKARIDLAMTLASRAPQQPTSTEAAAPRVAAANPARARGDQSRRAAADAQPRGAAGGRGAANGARQFQSLELVPDAGGFAIEDGGTGDAAAQQLLPPGFSLESSTEAVTASGSARPNEFFGPNGAEQFAQRFGTVFGGPDGAVGNGGAFGGPGGPGGGPGGGFAGRGGGPGGVGFGPGFGGPFGRGGRGNQIRGSFFQSFDTSGLDAAPYALNGQATTKPDYLQQRFGATIGGPLVIPKVVNSPRTFFFVNYTGNHSTNPFDAYSTVPTAAERAGDLSAYGRTIVDPLTGQPFAGNQIPASRIDPSALALLAFLPPPNQTGARQNFHTVTTNSSQLDDINVRIVHAFGTPPPRGGGRGGFGGGGRGGGRGGGAGSSNLNVAVHYRHADNTSNNVFPTLGGSSTTTAWDVPVGYTFTRGGLFNSLRAQFNRQQAQGTNLYAFDQNVAANAGVLGVSSDPFDWGVPNLSFSSLTSLRDMNPSTRTDRTIAIGDVSTKIHGRHTIRMGGDYRDIRTDSRVDTNARGSYVFTGFYTGLDYADFLLGLPQQASVQFGPGLEQFRSTSWDLFLQDDWRVTDKLTVNAGVRYEYFSPVAEADNRLSSLDVTPGFTAAAPVLAGESGPYSGAFADTIVNPFHAGFAPRVGIAWRPKSGTVVRAGYGINYNSSVYQAIAQQLAGQPPFAVASTVLATATSPLVLATALEGAPPFTTTNSFAVDPAYRLGMVQVWNLDLQRDLSRTVQLGIGYTGTKGSDLDVLRAPNRGPDGLRIAGVAPFIWESSNGDSIMNALTIRLRKRLSAGIAAGGSYTLSKSIDDASSIGGGGGGTVAQNDLDLAAERGLSSFDQRHRVSADFSFELPFGENKPWLQTGVGAALLGGWQINGSAQFASGTPYTVRVLGDITDVARGTNGTLRANYDGAAVALGNPTIAQFFNTAAFSIPAAGTFGDSERNMVIGPGTSSLNLGVLRNVALGGNRALTLQLLATNVFNTVQFASIDTVINSPTFGQVTGIRPMRRLQVVTRFRF